MASKIALVSIVVFGLLCGLIVSQTSSATFLKTKPKKNDCETMRCQEGAFSPDGDVIKQFNGTSVDGMTAEQCKATCLEQQASRYCVVANYVPADGSCWIAGYQLTKDNQTVHFRRICEQGRGCFKQIDGWSSHFHTGVVVLSGELTTIPTAAPPPDTVAIADFCRHHCEQMPTCVGFDVRKELSYCPYVQFLQTENNKFHMHTRRCWNRGGDEAMNSATTLAV